MELQILRETFNREQTQGRPIPLLTAAVSAGIETIRKGYEIPELSRLVCVSIQFTFILLPFHMLHLLDENVIK